MVDCGIGDPKYICQQLFVVPAIFVYSVVLAVEGLGLANGLALFAGGSRLGQAKIVCFYLFIYDRIVVMVVAVVSSK